MFRVIGIVFFTIIFNSYAIIAAEPESVEQAAEVSQDSNLVIETSKLKVISLNGWFENTRQVSYETTDIGIQLGYPTFHTKSKDIKRRFELLVEELPKLDPDIIFLQEIYSVKSSDIRTNIINKLAEKGYKYAVFSDDDSYFWASTFKGKFGNGLLILSKYPLDTNVIDFALQSNTDGYVHAIRTRVDLPGVGWVDLFNTYVKDKSEFTALDNEVQLEELEKAKEWIRLNSISKNVIVASSFESNELEVVINSDRQLENTLTVLNPDVRLATRDAANPYSVDASISSQINDAIYISSEDETLSAVSSNVIFNTKLSNDVPFLSDHYGVMTTFEVK